MSKLLITGRAGFIGANDPCGRAPLHTTGILATRTHGAPFKPAYRDAMKLQYGAALTGSNG